MTTEQARDYAARSVIPAMGLAGRSFTLEPPTDHGTRSSLHLIRVAGMPPLLLRAYDHRGQAARNVEALRHLDEQRLPAPRLVFYDLWRARVTVETWIEGTPHSALGDPAATRDAALRVADLLARYHAVKRDVWGRPAAAVRAPWISFAAATLRRARRMARQLRDRGVLEEAQADRVLARLSSWQETIGAIGSFNLVHNDANRHNFVLAAGGEVTPVDLHRLAYEPFPEEVVNALYHFCRKDPPFVEIFLRRYFDSAGAEAQALFERTRGFFEPLNYLKKMHRRSMADVQPGDEKLSRWRSAVMDMGTPS